MTERDGANISLWQHTKSFDFLQDKNYYDVTYDVIIVGGGITGITTALLLQKAGKRCIVLESHNLCYGTTGGTTAHINTLLDTPYTTIIKNFGKKNAGLVVSAVKEAIQLIKDNIREYNIDCEFEEAPALLFSQTEDQDKELSEIADACRELDLPVTFTGSLPVDIPFKRIMKAEQQAKFHPTNYVAALANVFIKLGGIIAEQCMVQAIHENNHVEVETSRGSFKSDCVVFATHIPPGVNLLHLLCVPYRSYAMAFEINEINVFDALMYDMYDPYHYWRTQKINDKHYLIVGGEDHKTAHVKNTESCFLNLEAYVMKYMKPSAIQYHWSSQYFESADGLPYIGHLPGHQENILVATGYGGNGMVYSGVAALLLSDMILQRDNPYMELFDPNRIKPVAGFKTFISHNADVVKQFVGKWLHHDKIEVLSDLAHDEGRVITYNGESIALYKDENGTLHALNPVCTHLKCKVVWNPFEKTWDCPCHGARYNIHGEVITGPANHKLEVIEIRQLIEEK